MIWMVLPAAGVGRAGRQWCPAAKARKVCQERVVSSLSSSPQTMWDVELKASTRFSNEVKGGCERPAPGAWRDQSQTEGGGRVRVGNVQTPWLEIWL